MPATKRLGARIRMAVARGTEKICRKLRETGDVEVQFWVVLEGCPTVVVARPFSTPQQAEEARDRMLFCGHRMTPLSLEVRVGRIREGQQP